MLGKECLPPKSVRRTHHVIDQPIDPLALYLQEYHETPLLTREQEIAIGKRLDAGLLAGTLIKELGDQLPTDEQVRLQEKVADRREAADWMARANQGLCVSVAKQCAWRGLPMTDLIAEGNIGLAIAIERWEWQKDQAFSTYATWWVRQKENRAIENQANQIRLPVNMQAKLLAYDRYVEAYQKKYNALPTDEDAATVLGISSKQVEHYHSIKQLQPLSLDMEIKNKKADEYMGGDLWAVDPAPSPEHQLIQKEEQKQLFAALDRLSKDDAIVMKLLYGLFDGEPKTYIQAERATGLNQYRIRQIEEKSLRLLRLPIMHTGILPEEIQIPKPKTE